MEIPPKPPKKRPTFYLPQGANIPEHWEVLRNSYSKIITWPSSSIVGKTYEIEINLDTRIVICDCLGFKYHGYCSHVRLFLRSVYKARRAKGVQDNSLEAFFSFDQIALNERQEAVFDTLMENGPLTDKQITAELGWTINRETPRRGELVEMGEVAEFGKIRNSGGYPETLWVAVDSLAGEA